MGVELFVARFDAYDCGEDRFVCGVVMEVNAVRARDFKTLIRRSRSRQTLNETREIQTLPSSATRFATRSTVIGRLTSAASITVAALGLVAPPWGVAPGSVLMAQEIDVGLRKVPMLPPGTRVGPKLPPGWTHLGFILNRRVEKGDVEDVPKITVRMAAEFRIMGLARVVRVGSGERVEHRLDRVGLGFTKVLDGAYQVVSSKDEDSSDRIGFIRTQVLATYEKAVLGDELRQVVRTPTMVIFDNDAIMLDNQRHRKMVLRHAVVVAPKTGKLETLIWLVEPGPQDTYKMSRSYIWVLPRGKVTDQVINVQANRFTLLGTPKSDAFAVVDYPNARKIKCPGALREVGATRTFDATSARQLEAQLQVLLRAL